MERVEVAIVGGGVAGLAAAAALRKRGHRVLVVEARDRPGGRILTMRDPKLPVPIELGAEFVHGDAPETTRLAHAAALPVCEVTGLHARAGRAGLRRVDYWRAIDRVLGRIPARGKDESFAAFLGRSPGGRALANDRAAALEFVQGFHAADPERLGVRSIAPEAGERPSRTAARLARFVTGYDQLVAALAGDAGGGLRLRTAVTAVDWERSHVELTLRSHAGRRHRLAARAVVIAVPLGVLQAPPDAAGGLSLRPHPERVRRALGKLAMGTVTRVALALDELPWPEASDPEAEGPLAGRLAFVHRPGAPFPVWWTAHPLRAPLLVAWTGGPAASALAGRTEGEIVDLALKTLAPLACTTPRRLRQRLRGAWTHDWQSDPWSRGAYSYAGVGGAEAAALLARPVQGTLFFAGEHTDALRSGTVEGGIASGLRAARQVHAARLRS